MCKPFCLTCYTIPPCFLGGGGRSVRTWCQALLLRFIGGGGGGPRKRKNKRGGGEKYRFAARSLRRRRERERSNTHTNTTGLRSLHVMVVVVAPGLGGRRRSLPPPPPPPPAVAAAFSEKIEGGGRNCWLAAEPTRWLFSQMGKKEAMIKKGAEARRERREIDFFRDLVSPVLRSVDEGETH